MTKDKLYKQLCECGITDDSPLACAVRHELDEFFKSNVCIPKGENRHTYADVLHEWIEGANMECGTVHFGKVYVAHKSAIDYFDRQLYRIKPSEPVYEWQWVCQEHKDTEFFVPSGWHTFEELQPQVYSLSRLEETKRVRS